MLWGNAGQVIFDDVQDRGVASVDAHFGGENEGNEAASR
jgi:hypothetical protein